MATALLPLKDLMDAKTRLGGLLRPVERRGLAQAMAGHVLDVLAAHPGIERTVLVSDDPSAHWLASQSGAEHWPEHTLHARGLNAVLAAAVTALDAADPGLLLILHADLPLLSACDIHAALTACDGSGVAAIGPDRHGAGTNLLAFPSHRAPMFHFGRDSFPAHLAAIERAGLACRILEREGLAVDLDEPGDLAELLSRPRPGNAVAAFLSGGELGARLRLALQDAPGASPLPGEVQA